MIVVACFLGAALFWGAALEAACRPRWEWAVTPLAVVGVFLALVGSLELSAIW